MSSDRITLPGCAISWNAMLPVLVAAIAITTSFEGGSLGTVKRVAADRLRCAVRGQADVNHRNRQANWYYFRLDKLPPNPLQIELTDLVGEYNFRPGSHAVTRNTRPVFSYDGRSWHHFTDDQVSWNEKEITLTLRFTPEHSRMWIAHTVPYTFREFDSLLTIRSPHLRVETIGRSAHGRPIQLLTVTDPGVPDTSKKVIWMIARQHAWETGTSWVADGAARFLLSGDAEAARLRRSAVFKLLPIFDPDGVAEGAVRFNVNGYDNNRNWDIADHAAMPEISALRRAIFTWLDAGRRLDLFLALHNTESSDYVEGPTAAYPDLAAQLVKRLRESTSFYDPLSPRNSMGAPIDKGRYMVHQAIFAERKAAAFLMELMVERHPRLGRLRTVRDFSGLGADLAKCLAACVP
jgi:hypothetical protein